MSCERAVLRQFQVETLCNYHVGETVLSLQKATLIPGGSESLVYTTLSGGVGMLVPFTSREVGVITLPIHVIGLTGTREKGHSQGSVIVQNQYSHEP